MEISMNIFRKKQVEIEKYDHTKVSVNIFNHKNEEIQFDTPCSVDLLLK